MTSAYDVVVIGSGFGGSVTALRLTEKGYRVAVLESGRRFDPDTLPKTSWDLRNFFWLPRLGLRGIQRISVLKVLEAIADVTGREVRIDRQEGQKGDMRDTLADTARAARDLGFIPRTPLAAGLKAEWEWICS